MKPISRRQKEILEAIKRYRNKHGTSPAIRDLCREFDVTLNAINLVVQQLVKKGFLMPSNGKSRSLVPVDELNPERKELLHWLSSQPTETLARLVEQGKMEIEAKEAGVTF